MKKHFMLVLLTLSIFCVLSATNLVNENIQSWTARASYGSYTQTITAGTVSMTQCIVQPSASASGTGSIGRVQMQATNGILELPSLASVGTAEFHLAAGGASRTLKLQQYIGSTWTDVTTFSGIGTTGATFTYDLNLSSSTTLRLANPSSAVYLHDIIITDYSGGTPGLAVLTTAVISSITQTTAVSGGNITSDGGSSVTARGVCWSTSSNPTISGSHTSDGSGIGSFVSSVTGLNAETLYYLRAYATNSQGTAYGDELSFTTSGTSPPATPVATSATNIGSSNFTANWNAASGATGYRFDLSQYSNFSSFVGSYNNFNLSSTFLAVSGLNPNSTYYYRVRAYNTNGSSANSNIIFVTTTADDPFDGYYDPVAGMTGNTLKNALHDLIDNNTYSSYNGAKTFLFQELDNHNGVVRCVYTGQDYSIGPTYNGSSNPNTEHTYAQSWFDGTPEESIKKADVHHLFITNSTVNSSRGNLPFDVVVNNNATYPSYNGYFSKRGTNAEGDTVFEPADQHKGNLARALLYFSVRYNMTLSQGGVDMLDRMLQWHSFDPVDASELTRNEMVLDHQGNRNPFVDHPEYAGLIWSGQGGITTVQFNPASAIVNEAGGSVSLSVQIQNPSSTEATSAQIILLSGTAQDVGNFSVQNITFPAGSSSNQNIVVNITDDSILEGDETLIFTIVNVSGGFYATTGNYDSFNLDIVDNDILTPIATNATNVGHTGFTANWNAAPGISSYLFDLSQSPFFDTFVAGYNDYATSGTSLVISGLDPGTTYYYRLRAVYNESYGPYSVAVSVSTPLGTPVLTINSAASIVNLSWTAVNGAVSYRVEVSDTPYGPFTGVHTTTGFSYSSAAGNLRFYRVIAIK